MLERFVFRHPMLSQLIYFTDVLAFAAVSLDVLENSKSDPGLLLDAPDMTCISCCFHRVINPVFNISTGSMMVVFG